MTKEKVLQSKILKDLRSYHNIVAFKIMRASDNGVPDIFFTSLLTGACMVETKKKLEKPTELQFHMIGKLNANGVTAYWADSWNEWVKIKEFLGLSHDTLA